ncbi:response regulator transcription factor [Desulfococcaceae bacterium HSG7]|nr:response regulator transcription factor [Desulfococcaceae bacterium HSG7]
MMLRTLIVEDNADFRNTFMDALGKRFPSMKLDVAVNGVEAMDKVKAFHPDVIFMDIRLPDKSGLELTTEIKSKYPQPFIIILTQYDLPEYREAARIGMADAFLTKNSLNLAKVEELIKSLKEV